MFTSYHHMKIFHTSVHVGMSEEELDKVLQNIPQQPFDF